MSLFQLIGHGRMDEHDCDIYQMINKVGQKKNTYTLWVTKTGDFSVPVRYEMMGYDSLLGSHYDKYLVDYSVDSFKSGKSAVPADKFNVTGKCAPN